MRLLSGPLPCTVPGCTWQLLGAQQLIDHVTQFHKISTNQRHQADSPGNYAFCHNLPQPTTADGVSGVLDQNLNWQQLGVLQLQDPPLGGAAVDAAAACFDNGIQCSQLVNDAVKEEEESVDGNQRKDVDEFFSFSSQNLNGSDIR